MVNLILLAQIQFLCSRFKTEFLFLVPDHFFSVNDNLQNHIETFAPHLDAPHKSGRRWRQRVIVASLWMLYGRFFKQVPNQSLIESVLFKTWRLNVADGCTQTEAEAEAEAGTPLDTTTFQGRPETLFPLFEWTRQQLQTLRQ